MDYNCIKDIAGPISYIWGIQDNLNTLLKSMDELVELRNDVNSRVAIEEANPMRRRTSQVAGWLRRADEMEATAEGIVRECSEEIRDRRLGGFCPKNCYTSYQLGKKLVRTIKDVDELKGQRRGFEIVAETLPPPSVQYMPTVPAPVMDLMVEKAWSCCINNERVGIMGIYGIGGVGKTTLLKQINNEFLHRRTSHFDVVIWVVVSKEVDEMKIQDDVAKRLVGLTLRSDESLEDRALKLHSVLSKKTFVILMDDIWKPVDLTTIGIPLPDIKNKSKVLFTTRSLDVCGQMKAREKIKVECLGSAEAWKLFQEEVGDEALNSHSEIPEIAKQVAQECGGLPLALITTGKAMASMKTPQEWKHHLKNLKESASEFPDMEDKVYSILKFSYDRLPDDTIRSCFLYCSMFPEDHSIKKEQLIRYWIGEGFLDGFDDIDDVENKGYTIIEILKRACLLESSLDFPGTEVKMHDVLRDLALWIGCDDGRKKNKLLVQAGVRLAEAPKVGKWREAERISLMHNNIKTLAEEAPKCPKLLILILSSNYYLENICNGFFRYMHVLRVLDLSRARIKVLPTSIVELVELRYLGLRGTEIKQLPREMKKLVKLKCLDLSYTNHLEFIPCGIISRFSGLQVLDFFGSNFEHWEAESDDIGQDEGNVGASIEELGRLEDLQHLSIRIKKVACLQRILASQKLASCTRQFCIKDCKIFIPENLKDRSLSKIRDVSIDNCEFKDLSWLYGSRNINSLGVCSCKNLKVLCNGLNPKELKVDDCKGLQQLCVCTSGCFTNLTHLIIDHCDALEDLSSFHGSTNLEILEISHCKGLRVGITGGHFPKLEYVEITECEALKDLSWLRVASRLRELIIHGCSDLQQICDGMAGSFPKLCRMEIKDCFALKDLSLLCGALDLVYLSVIDCECLELICDSTAGCFGNLHQVDIVGCNALKDLSWLCGATNLEYLVVIGCVCLELICNGTAGCFPKLCMMDIDGCNALKDLSWLCDAPKLEKISVIDCECLELIFDGTARRFPNLCEVRIKGCNALKDLSWLCGAPSLEDLFVSGCECLELICDGTAGCFLNLREVRIEGCNALKDLSWLCGARKLEELCVSDCECLELICNGTAGCFPNLHKVDIEGCNALKDLSWLCDAPNLEKLSVSGCKCLELICDGEDAEVKESPLNFSRLSSLRLVKLPELKSIPWHAIPPDTRRSIWYCPKATNEDWEAGNEDENDEEEDVEDEEVLPDKEEDLSEDENDEEEDVEDEEEDCSDLEAGNEDENVEEKDAEDEEVLPKKRRRLE